MAGLPAGQRAIFKPGNRQIRGRIRVSGLDRFIDICREARTRFDVERSAADAEHVLVDKESIVIPLAATRRVWAVSDRVKGFVPHASTLSQRWEGVSLR